MTGAGAGNGARLPKSAAGLAACLIGLVPCTPVAASPYRIPGMGAADMWEIKAVAKYSDKQDRERLWTAALDLTAPVLPGLETSLTVGRGRRDSVGEPDRWGTLDTEWAVKWEAIPIRENRPFGVTVEPALFIPTGSNGLGDKEFRAALPVVLGWDLGHVRLRALVGYERSLESSDDELSSGFLVEYKFTPRFSMGGEITTRMPSNALSAHKDIVDVGFKYEIREGWELQGRIGQTIRSADHVRTRDAALYLEVAL